MLYIKVYYCKLIALLFTETVHGHPSMVCGLWVLIGFLVFIIAEKLFMETDDKETDDDQDIDCVKIKSQECDSETENNNFMPVNGQIKEKQKLSKNLGFTLPGKKDYDVNFVSVNSNKNDKSNDYNELCREMQRKELNDSAKPTKVFNRTSIKNGGMKTDVSNNLTSNGSIPDKLSNLNEPVKEKPKHISGYLNLLANCIDNFTHGLAVGGSFLVSFRLGSLTTFAILIHEIPHEVGDFAILLKSGFNRWDAARAQLMTATGGIFGALIAVLCSGSGVGKIILLNYIIVKIFGEK